MKLWNYINVKAGGMSQDQFNTISFSIMVTIVATILVIAYWNWLYK